MTPSSRSSRVLSRRKVLPVAALIGLLLVPGALAADWKVSKKNPGDIPGQAVVAERNGKTVARFVYGEGQQLPYLAIFDGQGRQITNAGLDASGTEVGRYPHHRGIFIGWKRVRSELGVHDLWSMNNATMEVVKITDSAGNANQAVIAAEVAWKADQKDSQGSNLLISEKRRHQISKPAADVTQVDVRFELTAARDLTLDGDVQHAGIHFRAAHHLAEYEEKNSYLWYPDHPAQPGRVVGADLKWGEILFPINNQWYSVVQLSAPKNPVEEFSTREYGRFGFFFKRDMRKGETLTLDYRFVIREVPAPANAGAEGKVARTAQETQRAREAAAAAYTEYLSDLARNAGR